MGFLVWFPPSAAGTAGYPRPERPTGRSPAIDLRGDGETTLSQYSRGGAAGADPPDGAYYAFARRIGLGGDASADGGFAETGRTDFHPELSQSVAGAGQHALRAQPS